MRHSRVASLALGVLLAAASQPALAGGPLANCSSGQPFKWAAGGVNIPFNPDQGGLGTLTNAEAVDLVSDAFAAWTDVASSTASYAAGAPLAVDVTLANYEPFFNPLAPDGLSAIVFDENGQIFDDLFGPGSGILGFAGPEWLDPSTCTILEGVSFLNGPSFTVAVEAFDVMVHEFGHYSNLAHTAVNGQVVLIDDDTAPGANGPGEPFAGPVLVNQIETMYPFYSGAGQETASPHADDIASLSTLYPEPSFLTGTASIAGTIFAANGTTRLSGVNVIARNVADPFDDAVSAMSGDRTDDASQADALAGTYLLRGLTPGAEYAVFVDQILAGGFSTPPISLPGPEEFHNTGDSNNVSSPDDPTVFTAVSAGAGATATGVNVIFNTFAPGDILPVGDDGFVELFPKFAFQVCGQEFTSVFVNANGSLTFGESSFDFSESTTDLLGGLGGTSFLVAPPRIAALWDDLNPAAGGTVTYSETSNSFTVSWDAVPEFGLGGSNSFSITLKKGSHEAKVEYGDLSVTDGLAGLACGSLVTSGFENEQNLLRSHGRHHTVNLNRQTAAFEIFTAADNDLANRRLSYVNFRKAFEDDGERHGGNNDIAHADWISLPFTNASVERYADIGPVGGDVDYYKFKARAGDILAIEVVRGAPDTMIGVFDADTGELLAADDDGGCCGIGGLSRLLLQVPATIDRVTLAVAVTSWPDFEFDGTGGVTGGRYVLSVNKYRGEILATGDDSSTEVTLDQPFRFQGVDHSSVFVNSNGNLTFGAGDGDFTESTAEFLAGLPRIAALWDDLDASAGQGLVIAEKTWGETTIHFVSIPQFFDLAGNYFSVRLGRHGKIDIDYGPTARGDSLVGITAGGTAEDPGESDLSEGCRSVFPAGGTTYELFAASSPPEPFDLDLESLKFVRFH